MKDLLLSKHSVPVSMAFHLVPGIIAASVFFLAAWWLNSKGKPLIFAYHIETVLVLIPLLGIFIWLGGKDVYKYTNPLKFKEYLLYIGVSLFWAVLVFALLGNLLSDFILKTLFYWLPDWVTKINLIPDNSLFSPSTIKIAWFLTLITTSLATPLIEELYFRGLLMPKLSHLGIWVPVLSAVLFAVYHFWSPWLIPVRIIAIFPMIYFSWKTQNIYIAIWTHILLNLVGDSVLSAPQVWA
jgi:uncharacterized protein